MLQDLAVVNLALLKLYLQYDLGVVAVQVRQRLSGREQKRQQFWVSLCRFCCDFEFEH